jgi:hypothetical protein
MLGLCVGYPNQESGERIGRFRLLPIEEAARDPDLDRLLRGLRAAVKARNVPFVLETSDLLLQRQFRSGLALPRNPADGVEDPEWRELDKVLALGGAFTLTRGAQQGRREYCAPYVYARYPERPELNKIRERLAGRDENNEDDPWVVIADQVPAYERPMTDAKIVMNLSYDLILVNQSQAFGVPPTLWRQVFTPSGRLGWVVAEQVRDPNDYHACFARESTTWKMVAFERD